MGLPIFFSFTQNKWLMRTKDGKTERRIIRPWVLGLSSFLTTFAPMTASGMCDLPMCNKRKEAIFTGILIGIYGFSEVQELWTNHVINSTVTKSWKDLSPKGKRSPNIKNRVLLFTACTFKDNFQVIDNKAEVFSENAYKCLFMDAVHSPQLCRESSLYICR